MGGRLVSMGINLAAQVLIVRYLSRTDFGAFSYALAMAELSASFCVLGLDKSVARFGAEAHEQRDAARFFGGVLFSLGAILVFGLVPVGAALLFRGRLAEWLHAEPQAITLLLILLVIGPVLALDAILTAVFGVLTQARAIFLRRHLLGPGLRLAAILLTMAISGSALFLAKAYVVAVFAGLAVYLLLLRSTLGADQLVRAWREKPLVWEIRRHLGYGLVMLCSDLVFLFQNGFVVLVLEYYRSGEEVAGFRAIQPFARLNQVVLATFLVLFFPLLSRLMERGDREGVRHVIHETASWVALFSFPVFAITFGGADWISTHVLGEEYRDTATPLALLALGLFANATLGLGAVTLKVLGRLKTIITIDFLWLIAAGVASALVAPRWGVLGLVVVVDGLLVLHGLTCLAVLRRREGLSLFERGKLDVHLTLFVATAALVASRFVLPRTLGIQVFSVALSLCIVALAARRAGSIGVVFPELLRVSVLGPFLGRKVVRPSGGAGE